MKEVNILLPHAHECPDCHELFDCYCSDASVNKRCPDCFMQLKLMEFND